MEPLYKDPRTLGRMREGPLGAQVDAFAQQMIEQGYARASIRYALQVVADLGLPATVIIYLEFARRFLAQNAQEGEVHLDRLLAADVVSFVQREAARLHHAKRAKLMTTALRSFLQFARYRGFIKADSCDSVPAVASWSMASLPNALSADEVQRLLSSCERETAVGRRNGAICCCSPAWVCGPAKSSA